MRTALAALVLLVGCDGLQTAPSSPDPRFTHSVERDGGPPQPQNFGPDTYRVGLFTSESVTSTGLNCGESTRTWRTCSGFLASDVDGARLDVTVQIPHGPGPHPLVVLIHGYAGSKSSSGDIAERLLADGYAVLRYSARGFGQS